MQFSAYIIKSYEYLAIFIITRHAENNNFSQKRAGYFDAWATNIASLDSH